MEKDYKPRLSDESRKMLNERIHDAYHLDDTLQIFKEDYTKAMNEMMELMFTKGYLKGYFDGVGDAVDDLYGTFKEKERPRS